MTLSSGSKMYVDWEGKIKIILAAAILILTAMDLEHYVNQV